MVAVSTALAGCGGSGDGEGTAAPTPDLVREDTIEHIHGLGINPADDALFVASHSGLFRMAPRAPSPERVGDLRQDTMGFTVVGPNQFLGSGHPDARTDDPPHLGLIASDDGGRSWEKRSLTGRADFHSLTASGKYVYASDSQSGQLLTSNDGGAEWSGHEPPAPVLALAADPGDHTRVVAGTTKGVFYSRNAAVSWRRAKGVPAGLVSWAPGGPAFHVDATGAVRVSEDDGRTWRRRGSMGARPAAITAAGELVVVADEQGGIFQSGDAGRTFSART